MAEVPVRWTGVCEDAGRIFAIADVMALAASPMVSELVRLDLRHNRITRAGVEAIAESPHLRGLRGLDVAGNPVPSPFPTPFGEGPDLDWLPSAFHDELRARYGPLPWLERLDVGGLPRAEAL